MPTPEKAARTVAILGTLGFSAYLLAGLIMGEVNLLHASTGVTYWTWFTTAWLQWSLSWVLIAVILFSAGFILAQINIRYWSITIGIAIWGTASIWLFKTVDWYTVSGIIYEMRRPDTTQYKTVLITLLCPLVWGYLTPTASLKKLGRRLMNIIKWLRDPVF